MRLPRSLDALRDIAGLIAAHAASDVVVVAGVSHQAHERRDERGAARVLHHGRCDSRPPEVAGADRPGLHDGRDPMPAASRVDELEVRAFGGAFAGARLDIGTRALLAALDAAPHAPGGGSSEDPGSIACGTGIVGAGSRGGIRPRMRYERPVGRRGRLREATAAANGLADRCPSRRRAGGARRRQRVIHRAEPAVPPGAALTAAIAGRVRRRRGFCPAAAVVRVNSPLRYRATLERVVGPTHQVSRDPKFT
jgi:16S rRNA (guanine1207-N2)-methyltransferase